MRTSSWKKLLANPETPVVAEYRIRHKDGTWRWLSVKLSNQLHHPSIQALVLNGLERQGPAR